MNFWSSLRSFWRSSVFFPNYFPLFAWSFWQGIFIFLEWSAFYSTILKSNWLCCFGFFLSFLLRLFNVFTLRRHSCKVLCSSSCTLCVMFGVLYFPYVISPFFPPTTFYQRSFLQKGTYIWKQWCSTNNSNCHYIRKQIRRTIEQNSNYWTK